MPAIVWLLAGLAVQVGAGVITVDVGTENIRASVDGKPVTDASNSTEWLQSIVFTPLGRRFGVVIGQPEAEMRQIFRDLIAFVGRDPNQIIDQVALMNQALSESGRIKASIASDNDLFFEISAFQFPNQVIDSKSPSRSIGSPRVRLEELVGMQIENIQMLARRQFKQQIRAAHIIVPPWWGPIERKAMFSIVRLGGLDPQAFVSENAMLSLAVPELSDSPFVIFSYGQTAKASVHRHVGSKVETVAEAWIENAGADLTECIMRTFKLSNEQAKRAKM